MSAERDRLEPEWRKDTAALSGEVAAVFDDVLARHAEPHRRYHGQSHLVALFDLMNRHAPGVAPGTAPRLAIWWHDAVYDPTRADNEEKSAVLAREHLTRLGAPGDLIEEVARLILMTKNHWNGPPAGDGDCFLDADIAILGAPVSVYDDYAAGVRQEYHWAPDPAFRAGRSAFLNAALARPRLFRTDAFENTYAAQARANMQRELTALAT